ncbi:sensor histidine kinase [Pseudonocardia spinosispora]|uniref:sensor histidine kinase n=1 Tax=Pseudonocardia spinosispora TaxID=103441 RepID=UPI00041ABCEC|nr:sensor histidine kinase [Pseudonocardia spinosispora]
MQRPAAGPRLVAFALFAALVQVFGCFAAATRQPAARPLDVLAVLLLLAGPAALLLRYRFPISALAVTVVALVGYLAMGYPFGPIIVAFVFALLSAVIHGERVGAWITTAIAYPCFVAVAWLRIGPPGWWVLSGAAAWLLVLLSVGELVRNRWERIDREKQARADSAERIATEERLRIARDLHDVLAHHVSLINVQAGTALHLLDEQPGLAKEALTAIKASSKEVLVELRSMLGVLRRVDEELPRSPVAGLGNLDDLVERVRTGGQPVILDRLGTPRPLPAAVDTAAFRIVQEALTNVHRHAGAATATVRVHYRPGSVSLRVDDDGTATAPADLSGGNGLAGMRERALALGGTVAAGPRPEGGFRVDAELPAPTTEEGARQ